MNISLREYRQYMNIETVKRVIQSKPFKNFVILSSISMIQIITNVILGRGLSKDDYGRFSFVFMNQVNFLSVLFCFGQGGAILRFFSSRGLEEYKWKNYLFKIIAAAIIPILVISYAIIIYYGLEIRWYFIMTSSLFLLVCTNYVSNLFSSTGKVNVSTFLERIHSILFFSAIIIYFIIFRRVDLSHVSVLKLISFFSIIPILLYILIKWKSGPTAVGKDVVRDGLSLWEMYVTVLVLQSLDAFFIAKILSFNELALFNIVSMLLMGYDFVRISLFNVYSQKFSKTKDINIKALFLIIVGLIFMITLCYLIGANFILELFF